MTKQPVGFSCFQREDGIVVYQFTDSKRYTIEEWAKVSMANDQFAIEHNVHIRLLYLIKGITATPYAVKRVIDISSSTPKGIKESMAFIAGDTIVATLLNVIFLQINQNSFSSMQIFNTEEQGVRWLNQRTELIQKQYDTSPLTQRLNLIAGNTEN
jgi:hypothetical protein